jgi:tricorn protease
VPSGGGIARRLTNDVGYEMFAHFSPDGKNLAFTGQYDGNTEVYVMPADGGTPKRLTYSATLSRDEVSDRMGPNNIVMGWKDNDHIIYRSRMRQFNDFLGDLMVVDLKGNMPEQLPVPRGGFVSFSPDGKKMAYNRIFREFRTWKRYRGGMADDIWIYDFATKKTEAIAPDPAVDDFPMWSEGKIYFLSDRGEAKRSTSTATMSPPRNCASSRSTPTSTSNSRRSATPRSSTRTAAGSIASTSRRSRPSRFRSASSTTMSAAGRS